MSLCQMHQISSEASSPRRTRCSKTSTHVRNWRNETKLFTALHLFSTDIFYCVYTNSYRNDLSKELTVFVILLTAVSKKGIHIKIISSINMAALVILLSAVNIKSNYHPKDVCKESKPLSVIVSESCPWQSVEAVCRGDSFPHEIEEHLLQSIKMVNYLRLSCIVASTRLSQSLSIHVFLF